MSLNAHGKKQFWHGKQELEGVIKLPSERSLFVVGSWNEWQLQDMVPNRDEESRDPTHTPTMGLYRQVEMIPCENKYENVNSEANVNSKTNVANCEV